MANLNKRLEKLEHNISSPAPNAPSDEELATRLMADFEELQAKGHITQDGELSPDCPMEQRPMAILGCLLLRGEL